MGCPGFLELASSKADVMRWKGRLLRGALRARALFHATRAEQELDIGHDRSAEREARRGLAIARNWDGPDLVLVARLWNARGIACKYQGRLATASRGYARASEALLARGRRDPGLRAALLHNRGGLEHARGRFARAEVLTRAALTLRLAAATPDSLDVARDIAALAAIVDARGRHGEAETLFLRAASIFERRGGPPRERAALLADLAVCLHARGAGSEAERIGALAAEQFARSLGAAHPEARLAAENLEKIRRAASSRARQLVT